MYGPGPRPGDLHLYPGDDPFELTPRVPRAILTWGALTASAPGPRLRMRVGRHLAHGLGTLERARRCPAHRVRPSPRRPVHRHRGRRNPRRPVDVLGRRASRCRGCRPGGPAFRQTDHRVGVVLEPDAITQPQLPPDAPTSRPPPGPPGRQPLHHRAGPRPGRPRSACNDAAFTTSFRWAVGDTGSKGYLKDGDLWRGYEDGTATYYFLPGTYLQFRPSHREQGDIVIDHRAHLLAAIVELGDELELPATRNGRFRGAAIPEEGCAVSAGRRRCGGRRPVR